MSADALERGRAAYSRRAWQDAYTSLSAADEAHALDGDDLELLATSVYMLGRDSEWMDTLARAHHAYAAAGQALRAVRCAFWIGATLARRGETAQASGWLGRAQRLLEHEERECAEHGFFLLPLMFQQEAAGDYASAAATAGEAVAIAERFGDSDLFALAVHAQGQMLIQVGRVRDGLGLLDEAMVAVTTAELSPIVTGLVYCGVIAACQEVYEVRRAQEWTAALTRWCDEQPDLLAFTGACLVHRAEILQLRGAWRDALEQAREAGERQARQLSESAAAHAIYRQGELHRLRGDLADAETAYREASRLGWEPQPGLALLRLAQGNTDAAAAAIRRALSETAEPLGRARLLPACIEIMLASDLADEARAACEELGEISAAYESDMLAAMVSYTIGATALAGGDAQHALIALRKAARAWQELEAPYEAARARELIGLACRDLGDDDTAVMELDAARAAFARLEAGPDLARVDSHGVAGTSAGAHGLTPRELEVLRLVAAGKSNREIASALVISEHTVARHVQNIFAKLSVSSRTAASAFAFQHDLV